MQITQAFPITQNLFLTSAMLSTQNFRILVRGFKEYNCLLMLQKHIAWSLVPHLTWSWVHTIDFGLWVREVIDKQKKIGKCEQRNHMPSSRWLLVGEVERFLLFVAFDRWIDGSMDRWIDRIKVANWFVWSHAERQNGNKLELKQRTKLSPFEKNECLWGVDCVEYKARE